MPITSYGDLSAAYEVWRAAGKPGGNWLLFLGENPLKEYERRGSSGHWDYIVNETAYDRIQLLLSPHWYALLKAHLIQSESS